MINYDTIAAKFTGLVGWRQIVTESGSYELEPDLVESRSGLRYNRHAYLTQESIQAIAPDYVEQFATDAERATAFNEWLRAETVEGIKETVAKWWTKKVKANTARTLLAQQEAYWYEGAVKYDTPPAGKRLGFYIKPFAGLTSMLKIRITHVGVMLSEPQSVDVVFQADTDANPFATKTVAYTGNGEQQWIALPEPVVFTTSGFRGFYVYYVSDSVTGQVVTYRGSCNCRMSSRFVSVTGISANGTSGTISSAVTRENFGLNAMIEVYCDYTDFIINQAHALAPVISLQVADRMLRYMAANPSARLNRHEGMSNPDRILYQIDGDPQGRPTALSADLETAYAAASFDRENVDEYCLPCNDSYGIKRLKNG